MKLINLYGGPGTGKSTTAAQIFATLKKRGYNAELVTEFAKDLTWHSRHETLKDQLYILGKQHHKIFMLKDQVDYIVTDSPIILSSYYNKLHGNMFPESFNKLVLDIWAMYDSFDIMLKRSKSYNPKGRSQTEEDAKKIDGGIENMLHSIGINFFTYGTSDEEIEKIIEFVTK
jgi:tRNA uridine 5-carbamoylmethylation protein Kti12